VPDSDRALSVADENGSEYDDDAPDADPDDA